MTPVSIGLRQASQKRLWFTAFGVAFGLHAGAAAIGFMDHSTSAPVDDGGYVAIDLVAPPSSPKVDAPDVPVGPESPDIAPSVAANAHAAPVQPDDTPPVPIAETADALRQAPPTPPVERPPEDVKPDPTPQLDVQSDATAPSEAKAPPKIEAQADDHPAAPPIIGTSDADAREKITWIKLLSAHLDRNKRFPAGQKAERHAVEVRLRFQLDADGRVIDARVIGSSGNAAFDAAALATLTRASPVPKPPASVLAQGAVFTIPIVFRSKD
jgi:TonB family protein